LQEGDHIPHNIEIATTAPQIVRFRSNLVAKRSQEFAKFRQIFAAAA